MSKSSLLPAALAALALAGCTPKSPSELGRKLVVHGVVVDAALLTPLPGVKVTLHSIDGFPSATTDALGYFQFASVLQTQNLLVQFQKDGYQTVTIPVNPTLIRSGCCGDGGIASFPGFGDDVDGFNASIALQQLVLVPVAGTVYASTEPAKQAQVLLATPDGVIGYQAKTGDDGRFSFPGVLPGPWDLIVLPYDRDGDGLSDTQTYVKSFDLGAAIDANLGNLVVILTDVVHGVVASSFTQLSKTYPLAPADLVAGLTGVLPIASAPLFLHFGAEVDDKLTSFELFAVEKGPRYSAPIALAVAWEHGSVAKLTPASALVPSSDTAVGYELRIRALRFRDGTKGIDASPTSWGTISFAVQGLPVALPSPTPSLFFGNKFTATQTVTKAVVDASVIWLLDANNDFPFDTVAAKNFDSTTGLQLQWQHVPGAVKYRVWGRSTTSAGNNGAAQLEWRELLALAAPDPNENPTVVATGVNFWKTATSTAPWSFGNAVQFAVTAEDALGFRSAIDPSKVLSTKDEFPGLLTGVELDNPALPLPFTPVLERGFSFAKTVRLTFSEAMNAASAPPTLTSQSTNVSIKKVIASAWGESATSTSNLPLNAAQHAFLNLLFNVKGACTEVLVGRTAGDTLVPVRDASLFDATGTSTRMLFLDGTSGAFLAEVIGLTSVDAASNCLTLDAPLATGVNVPASSLACALSGTVPTLAEYISASSTAMVVNDATPFFVGESVLVYEPQVSGAGQIADVRLVTGVDTTTGTLQLKSVPTAGHTTASLVLPLNGLGGEVPLRGSIALTLAKDALGGNDTELFLTSAATSTLVGDTLLIDADGDPKTTVDQVQVKVKQVKSAPTAAPPTWSIVVDLPLSPPLLHGRSKVVGLGDSFAVGSARDTSATAPRPLDPHRDQFTIDGVLY